MYDCLAVWHEKCNLQLHDGSIVGQNTARTALWPHGMPHKTKKQLYIYINILYCGRKECKHCNCIAFWPQWNKQRMYCILAAWHALKKTVCCMLAAKNANIATLLPSGRSVGNPAEQR
jgi:hypothetical protein